MLLIKYEYLIQRGELEHEYDSFNHNCFPVLRLATALPFIVTTAMTPFHKNLKTAKHK